LTRIVSAAVLLPLVVGTIWFLPPFATQLLTGLVAAIAFSEYAELASQGSAGFPYWLSAVATLAVFVGINVGLPLELAFAPALVVMGAAMVARGRPHEDVLRAVAVALLPMLYIAVPLALAGTIRVRWGAAALLLPFFTIVASDSAQYFGGRALGRVPLAPAVSPKKTVEGAVCGFLAGGVVTPLLGAAIFPTARVPLLIGLGLVLVGAGIVGDLFESLIKRSVGVKDSSRLIPGHGGILDRIDALLFACPVYYVFLWLLPIS
jgi:phosphatidate cytidylyltransferase